MQKINFFGLSVIFLIISSCCFAGQGSFVLPANANNNNVMSSSEFKSTVSTMGVQAQDQLNNSLKQTLTKKMPQQGETVDTSASTTSAQSTQPSQPAPKKQIQKQTPSNTSQDVYTGFGGGSSKPSSSPASGGNSGGWNINY